MRQYWIPCALSSELAADGAPMRLPLLGEKLIAFRDSSGRVGIMDHRCPHRCASLFLGRNEKDGLRCVYHGWKFDTAGNCVDMPSVPEGEALKHKIHAKAYKAAERNGMIWVYMGPNQEAPPPLPQIEPNLLPEGEAVYSMVFRSCNWLQALEGEIDTSHFGFLHMGAVASEELDESHRLFGPTVDRAPQYEVIETPWGTSYGAFRHLPQGGVYWRTANFLFPFWTQNPAGPISKYVHARAWVPIDDTRTMFVNMHWKEARERPPQPPLKSGRELDVGYQTFDNLLPNTTDWYGRWRLQENESNDWMIDREAQSTGVSYTGIGNIHLQDQSVTESMGPITDHRWEHLTSADLMIARTRRRILRAARAFRETGAPPPGIADPEVLLQARGGHFVAEEGKSWQDAYAENLATVERPVEKLAGDR
ncbi:MAG: Rieske 2Fe-2S domain-containing protein [Sphingomonas sp.]